MHAICLSLCLFIIACGAMSAHAESCLETVGAARAQRMVRQCLDVSAATHPPCNADNACALIQDEIRRGCQGLGADAPGFCDRY